MSKYIEQLERIQQKSDRLETAQHQPSPKPVITKIVPPAAVPEPVKPSAKPMKPINMKVRSHESTGVNLTLDKRVLLVFIAIGILLLVFPLAMRRGKKLPDKVETVSQTHIDSVQDTAASEPEAAALPQTAQPAPSSVSEIKKGIPAASEVKIVPAAPRSAYFTLQLAAFKSESVAEKETQKLKASGYNAFIVPHGRFYQLCIEKFGTRDEAKAKLLELETQGFMKMYRGAFIQKVR